MFYFKSQINNIIFQCKRTFNIAEKKLLTVSHYWPWCDSWGCRGKVSAFKQHIGVGSKLDILRSSCWCPLV